MLKIIRHRHLLPCCFEALWDLMVCKLLILFIPFHRYAKNYGIAYCESLHEDMSFAHTEINAIRTVLRKIPQFVPWKSKCLDQAMAAQRMLKRRGLQNTLYFGVAKGNSDPIKAHAWLRCGDRWVVGYQPHIQYTIVGVYASEINRAAILRKT